MNNNQMGNTQRIKAVDPGMAKGKAKELLDAVVKKYGGAPNSFKTMAHSPAGFQGFLDLSGTLEGGVLPFETRLPNCDSGLGDQWLRVLPFRFHSDRQGRRRE